jgi:Protein of unknown function (DUF732)
MRGNKAVGHLVAIAAAVGLGLATAPSAYADEHDDAFLLELKHQDILVTGDPAGAVEWAHWACDQLNQGAEPQHVVQWLIGYNPAKNMDFGATDAQFLRVATIYYCPAYRDAASQIASRGR